MFETREPSIEALRHVVAKAPVKLRYRVNGKTRKVLMDCFTASAILAVHDAVSPENQAKLVALLTTGRINTLAQFCLSKCGR